MNEQDIEVTDNGPEHRFEIRTGGELAGFAAYGRRGERIVFTHTEIDDAFEGRGLGSELIGAALAQAKEAHQRVVPLCPFVASYIERHPELGDLVDHELYDQLRGS